ncbi:MAG: AMP-binding protein, partial [Parvularculaceae bacterium]|nr:AMP-binding protein [Parvularculaceae bacterium]
MTEVFPVDPEFAKTALYDLKKYERDYKRSIDDPEGFWKDVAKRLDWAKAPTKIKDVSFHKDDFHIRWYEDGELNACVNCVDRHLEKHADDVAIIWEGDNPADSRTITYRQLHEDVCRMANILKARDVKKGDRVIIYMPMIPEAAVAMLACARIGAIHSVVFGGFSHDSLATRIEDCGAVAVITADEGVRGGRKVHLKKNVDAAIEKAHGVRLVLVVNRTGGQIGWTAGRDLWWHEAREDVSPNCTPEIMNAEDPLFILYTSGSTGKPKGVLHTTGGYLVFSAFTHEAVFNYKRGDIYWCTADIGWVTGHTYIVYGPLANGATTLMFEGVPTYPDASRFWNVCDKHKVNI